MSFHFLLRFEHMLGMNITGQSEHLQNLRADKEIRLLLSREDAAVTRLNELRFELVRLLAEKEERKMRKLAEKRLCPTLLHVSPHKLYFPTPLDKYIMNTLSLQSISDYFLIFKIKATAPFRYAVKPRHGVIPPRGEAEIHVHLRPTEEDPSTLLDKFLVEARTLQSFEPNWQALDCHTLWEKQYTPVASFKLKCKFTSKLPARFIVKAVIEARPDSTLITTDKISASSFGSLQTSSFRHRRSIHRSPETSFST